MQPHIQYLANIATGKAGKPTTELVPDKSLFRSDERLTDFSDCHFSGRGSFDRHYWASIPYIFEQECRLGLALLEYAHRFREETPPLTLWHIGAAEATLTKTLSRLGQGAIVSFADTGSAANLEAFRSSGVPEHAFLYVGHHTDVNHELLRQYSPAFANGFDVIIEDTCFQMLGRDRFSQIKNVKQLLKDGGILILTEKFSGPDYSDWEEKKAEFKRRYFSEEAIEDKRQTVLTAMEKYQVSIEEIKEVASRLFAAGVIFWNSGNFHSIALSDSTANLKLFVAQLGTDLTPSEFSRGGGLVALFGQL